MAEQEYRGERKRLKRFRKETDWGGEDQQEYRRIRNGYLYEIRRAKKTSRGSSGSISTEIYGARRTNGRGRER